MKPPKKSNLVGEFLSMGKRRIFTITMLISQSDDHRPADVGETEAEVAEGKAELDREMGRGAKIGTKKG